MKNILNLLVFFCIASVYSQIKITKEQAFEWAKQSNPNQKIMNLHEMQLSKLIGSQRSVAPINIAVEYGQINSIYKDNRLSVMQAFQLPKFYSSQKNVLEMELKNFASTKKIQAWQLKKSIDLLYNESAYLHSKLKFIKKVDSLYLNYLNRTNNRLKFGETNMLEKTLAENWKSQSSAQIQTLLTELEMLDLKLNYIINQNQSYAIPASDLVVFPMDFLGSDSPNSEFLLEVFRNDIQLQEVKLAAEKAKNLPSFTIAANTMTMFGNGANNVEYDYTKRFNSIALGLNLPLFNKAKKALIEAQKINQLIAEQELQNQNLKLNFDFQQRKLDYQKIIAEINTYENQVQKNQQKIINTATKQLQQGEIQYLEWFILVSQQFDNESKNIDRIKMANDALIEMKALVQPL